MGSKGRLLIDLNEPPIDFEDDNDDVVCFQPQRAIPSTSAPSTNLFAAGFFPHGIVNNHAFSHTSSVSGFQPFVRPKVDPIIPEISAEKRSSKDIFSSFPSSFEAGNAQDLKAALNLESGSVHAQAIEKEEGEWSDVERSGDADGISVVREESSGASDKQLLEKETVEMMESNVPAGGTRSNCGEVKNEIGNPQLAETSDKKCDTDHAPVPKQREVRGTEANHALKSINNLGKRPKFDKQKEAMLGKKRSRQTMFLNLEEVKQVGALKSKTPKRKNPAPNVTRAMKESRPTLPSTERGDKQTQPVVRDTNQGDILASDRNNISRAEMEEIL